MRTHNSPSQTVGEDVQHQFFAMWAVSRDNGGTNGIGNQAVQIRWGIQTKITERPLAKIGRAGNSSCLYLKLL